ncbi:MAG: phosphatase PAP2 family protein [Pseudoxanthomonas sp.]
MPLDTFLRGAQVIAGLVKRNAWRIGLLFVGMLLPLWIFAELADEVHEMEQFVFDDPILLRAHALAGPGLDGLFMLVSKIGYEGVVVIDILLVIVLLMLRHWREASFTATAFLGSALLNLGAKQFFQRHRPTLWESISPEDTFSFPSGHAMGSMTLAMTVILLAWPSRWRWPALVLASAFTVLVGYSRVYLGVHFPSDILAGWTAGTAWVVGAYLVLFHKPGRPWNSTSITG